MEQIRKTFSEDDYKANDKAFQYLQRDILMYNMEHGTHYCVELREEDYGIDVALYYNEEKKYVVCYFELEMKTQKAGNWKKGNYPYPDLHCLYRKDHLILQVKVPFWICYNYDGSDCAFIPMETIPIYPLAKNRSGIGDLVHVVPTEAFIFGGENIIPYIEAYVNSQVNGDMSIEEKFELMNYAYRCRHRYNKVIKAQYELSREMQEGKSRVGISGYI